MVAHAQENESRSELVGTNVIVEFYGIPLRNYQRLKSAGMPFGNPISAAEWWDEAKNGRKRPGWLLQAVEKWEGGPEKSKKEEGFEISDAPDFGVLEQLSVARALAKGLGDQVRLRAAAGKSITAVAGQYQKAAAELRQLERTAPRVLIEQGSAWPKEEVADRLREVGNAINRGMDNLAAVISAQLSQMVSAEDLPRCRQVVEDEVNRLRQPWSQGVFEYVE